VVVVTVATTTRSSRPVTTLCLLLLTLGRSFPLALTPSTLRPLQQPDEKQSSRKGCTEQRTTTRLGPPSHSKPLDLPLWKESSNYLKGHTRLLGRSPGWWQRPVSQPRQRGVVALDPPPPPHSLQQEEEEHPPPLLRVQHWELVSMPFQPSTLQKRCSRQRHSKSSRSQGLPY